MLGIEFEGVAEGEPGRVRWKKVTPSQWHLVDDTGRVLRGILQTGALTGEHGPSTKFRVTGEGYTAVHDSLEEAMAAGAASLPSS